MNPPVINWLLRVGVYLLRVNSACPRLKPFALPDSRPCECTTCVLVNEGLGLMGK